MTTRNEALRTLTAPGEPYELETIELNGQPYRTFRNGPQNLRQLYQQTRSDLTFIVYEDERYTYEAIWQRACQLATTLRNDYGITHGARVAISMRNYPEWIIAFSAVTSIGAIAVAMNAFWQPEEMAYGLKDSGARVLLADHERLERLAQCLDPPQGLAVIAVRADPALAPGARAFEAVLASTAATAMPEVEVHPGDDAALFYTSGSTGHPKGVVLSHRGMLTALLSWELDGHAGALVQGIELPEPSEQPATLLAVPLFHATGSHAVYLASYRAQRRIVSMYKWEVEHAAELIERERISSFVAPAAMTGDLVAAAHRTHRDLGSLARVGGGGAPRAPEQVRNIGDTFAQAMPNTGWGMTETNAIGTGIAGQAYLERPASSGQPSAVLDLRIVDDAGETLAPGERGELQVHGTSVVRGYWNRPDANADAFVDGWLRTGDVAYLDEDGFLFIVDRIKDLVIRGGENIGCGAVEAALLEHPDVLEASVYGVPDERLGEEVGATIHAQTPVTDAELRRFLGERLAQFEIPRYLRCSDEPLPRTASGKILKRELREAALARRAG